MLSRLTALLFLLTQSCIPGPPGGKFVFQNSIGVAVQTGEQNCLSISNAALARGTAFDWATATPLPSTGQATVVRKLADPCTPGGQPGLNHYEFKLTRGALPPGAPAFAVFFGGTITVADRTPSADLDRDGHPEFFYFCTTTEGVFLSVWTDKRPAGRHRWRQYHYLGYDVVATCQDSDTQDVKP